MSRYSMLVKVLDQIRNEAAATAYESEYAVNSRCAEKIWQARSRAFIHLYLKVMFGIDDFLEREECITDGGGDGGLDGFYIDRDQRTIYLIQSKFRTTEENFEQKPITPTELLSMDVRKILSGEEPGEDGRRYNARIRRFQGIISEIPDIGRYKYKVIILANLRAVSPERLRKLSDGYPVDLFNFARTYDELLFPVLSGTLFKASGLAISLDLSNKSAGTKISYQVPLGDFDCDITVVFVPTLEIARIMASYKNSILLYNPRSYLEFEGEKVNAAIRASILDSTGNEFALLNNGITIVCNEISINEQSGRRHRAQLFLVNPQIINGGQTAYTLSRIYESLAESEREAVFLGKEVLVKAIALSFGGAGGDREAAQPALIERISVAANSQTVVTHADRSSGDPLQIAIQKELFSRYGLLLERKRGEFSDAIRNKLVRHSDVIPRTLVPRLHLAVSGKLKRAVQRKIRSAQAKDLLRTPGEALDEFFFAYKAFLYCSGGKQISSRASYAQLLPQVFAARVVADRLGGVASSNGAKLAEFVRSHWDECISAVVPEENDDRGLRRRASQPRSSKEWIRREIGSMGSKIQCYFGSVELPDELTHASVEHSYSLGACAYRCDQCSSK